MISDITPRATSNCNGVLKNFTFSFPIINSSDLVVFLTEIATGTVTTLTETTDYVVADPNGIQSARANYANGGSITTMAASAYSSAYTITIERVVPYTQTADLTEAMPTLYETFEDGLDKLTMLVQQVKFIADRAPHAPSEDSLLINMEMPNATARANHLLGFDAEGDPIAADYWAKVNAAAFVGNNIVFTLTDGSTVTITGGKTAITGPTGETGATITATAWSGNDMVFTKSDLSTVTLANAKVDLKGETGAKGDTGSQGAQGSAGANGTNGTNGTNGLNGAPIGAVVAWPAGTVPADYLECDGSSLLRATYASLFGVISDDYGAADGTHFNLPDYRGRFLRGWSHGQTTDPDKATRTDRGDSVTGDYVGTKQGDDYKAHHHHTGPIVGNVSLAGASAGVGWRVDSASKMEDSSTAPETGGNETRPKNINVMFCIKYQ